MNKELLQSIIPPNFADNSRVWIYQSSRPFTDTERIEIDEQLYHFYAQWQAHGAAVKGWAKLIFDLFIVIIADENDVKVSGCSTDSSVRVIKSMERQYAVNMFDRMSITFLINDKPEMLPFHQVQYALDKGFINGDTLLFNNLVSTKKELLQHWLQPLRLSWLKDRVNLPLASTYSGNE